jgi:hypothetical protein
VAAAMIAFFIVEPPVGAARRCAYAHVNNHTPRGSHTISAKLMMEISYL